MMDLDAFRAVAKAIYVDGLPDAEIMARAGKRLVVHLSCSQCHWVATVHGEDVAERVLREHAKGHA